MMAVFRGFDAPIRSILRVCLVVVAVIITAYLVYLLQRPITWLVIAAFLAIAVSGPIAVLARHMRKGLAIATVYGALVAFPIVLLVIFLPPLVGEVEELVNNLPEYAEDVTTFVNESDTLSKLNEDYDITGTHRRRGQGAAIEARRRDQGALRHRRWPRQLDLRAGHDPDPLDLHGLERGQMDREVPCCAGARARRAHAPGVRAHRRGDRRLCGRGAPPGDHRGRRVVRRPDASWARPSPEPWL